MCLKHKEKKQIGTKEWEKLNKENINKRKTSITILISNKINFKVKIFLEIKRINIH